VDRSSKDGDDAFGDSDLSSSDSDFAFDDSRTNLSGVLLEDSPNFSEAEPPLLSAVPAGRTSEENYASFEFNADVATLVKASMQCSADDFPRRAKKDLRFSKALGGTTYDDKSHEACSIWDVGSGDFESLGRNSEPPSVWCRFPSEPSRPDVSIPLSLALKVPMVARVIKDTQPDSTCLNLDGRTLIDMEAMGVDRKSLMLALYSGTESESSIIEAVPPHEPEGGPSYGMV